MFFYVIPVVGWRSFVFVFFRAIWRPSMFGMVSASHFPLDFYWIAVWRVSPPIFIRLISIKKSLLIKTSVSNWSRINELAILKFSSRVSDSEEVISIQAFRCFPSLFHSTIILPIPNPVDIEDPRAKRWRAPKVFLFNYGHLFMYWVQGLSEDNRRHQKKLPQSQTGSRTRSVSDYV